MSSNNNEDESVLFIEECKPLTGGWLQLNDTIVPYVDISDKIYKFTERFVHSKKYVPLDLVLKQNVLSPSRQLKTILSPLEKQVDFLNNLISNEFDSKCATNYKCSTLKLVNIYEVIYEAEKLCFLKKLPRELPNSHVYVNYSNIINLSGGLLILKKSVIPFILIGNKRIIPYGCILMHLNNYSETRDSLRFIGNQTQLAYFKEFFELLIFYVCLEQKFPQNHTLLDITPLCEKHPNDFMLLCEFTCKFPLDWKFSVKSFIENLQTRKTSTNSNIITRIENGANNRIEGELKKESFRNSNPVKTKESQEPNERIIMCIKCNRERIKCECVKNSENKNIQDASLIKTENVHLQNNSVLKVPKIELSTSKNIQMENNSKTDLISVKKENEVNTVNALPLTPIPQIINDSTSTIPGSNTSKSSESMKINSNNCDGNTSSLITVAPITGDMKNKLTPQTNITTELLIANPSITELTSSKNCEGLPCDKNKENYQNVTSSVISKPIESIATTIKKASLSATVEPNELPKTVEIYPFHPT